MDVKHHERRRGTAALNAPAIEKTAGFVHVYIRRSTRRGNATLNATAIEKTAAGFVPISGDQRGGGLPL